VTHVFYILDPKDEKKHLVVMEKYDLSESRMWRMRKNIINLTMCLFFVDTKRINIVETKICYSIVISYACTDGEEKHVHC
jgi:hypothetical protein